MKITRQHLRQIIKEEVDKADAKAAAKEAVIAFGFYQGYPRSKTG